MKADLTAVKPYGDTLGDGIMQLSFTLPVNMSAAAKEAARQLAAGLGLENPSVVHAEAISDHFSFFVIYASCRNTVDMTKIVAPEVKLRLMTKQEIDSAIARELGRKLRVIGACIESDAHTVGIDAIINMKGINGHKGLESYHEIEAVNLGAQVTCEELIRKIHALSADVALVSQVVTQKNIHITNLTRLIDMLEAEGLRDKVTLVAGGPRITHELAKELGYDAGFGPNTYAEHVASFLVDELRNKQQRNGLSTQMNGDGYHG